MTASPNTQLYPSTYKIDDAQQEIMLGGVGVRALAQQFGTPLYILDESTIRQMMHDYKSAFEGYPAPVKVLFAAKANLSMGLCALIQQEGLGLDVVSGGELYTALQAKFPAQDILFNGNNKSAEELALAIAQNVGFISVDNPYELSLIDKIAGEQGKKVSVLLRITPGIECHTHDYIKTGHLDSKFGFDLSRLSGVIEQIQGEYANTVELKGLHAHIGSQIFETQPYHDLAEVMLNLCFNIREQYGITLSHLNLGGGLGIAYQNQDDPPEVSQYGQVLISSLMAYAQKIGFPLPALFLEPGRSLVATAGCTLYTVGSAKAIPELDKTYVAVDGGMGDNIRPALYGAQYTALVANKPHEPHTKTVTLAGKYCESGDLLIKTFKVPESIAAGDLVLVLGTGAYNSSMASNYNRVPRPATVLVYNGQAELLIKRETYDDLIAQDLIPARFLNTPVA